MKNGWMENGEVVWVDDAFPDDIMDIQVDEDFDEGNTELKLNPQDDSDDENVDDQICDSVLVMLYVIFPDD